MAETRFITRTPDGRMQLNNRMPGHYFVRKERISVGKYYGTYATPNGISFVAFRPVDTNNWLTCSSGLAEAGVFTVRLSSGTSYITGEVDVYLFAPYSSAPDAAAYGKVRFNLRDANNKLTFIGTLPPLKVVATPNGAVTLRSGRGDSGGHVQDGYSKELQLPKNRTYAVMFSMFLPSLESSVWIDVSIFEVVVRIDPATGIFKAQQKRHKFADGDSGSYYISWGSEYISHLIVDVTYL